MSNKTPLFIFHPENKAFIHTKNRTGTPPQLGLSPIKTAMTTFLLFIIPTTAILIGIIVYFMNNNLEQLQFEIKIAIIVGFVTGIAVLIYALYIITNTLMKANNLNKQGRLLKGKIQSINVENENLEIDEFSRNLYADYFLILKIEYVFKSPQSNKELIGKTRQRYMPEKLDRSVTAYVGHSCAVYYATDRAHVLL